MAQNGQERTVNARVNAWIRDKLGMVQMTDPDEPTDSTINADVGTGQEPPKPFLMADWIRRAAGR